MTECPAPPSRKVAFIQASSLARLLSHRCPDLLAQCGLLVSRDVPHFGVAVFMTVSVMI
jgi:hypothetical protein